MKHILAAVLWVVFLAACEHQVTAYGPQPATLSRATAPVQTLPSLTVTFVTDVDAILVACPELTGGTYYGCAKPKPLACEIYVQEPASFDDVPRLATLGHELFHCLGARHAAAR